MDRITIRRSRLYVSCAGLALATALAIPHAVQAQGFQGSPEVVAGSADIDRGTPGVDTITVSTPTAVIDWFPTEDSSGDALTFLPNGNTGIFQDSPGQGGFAVLNRIMPSTNGNIAVFDGAVISRLQDASGNFTPGGFVAFYSPTGILVGSNATFDVGQLLLTTMDIDPFNFDSFYTQGGSLFLNGAADSTARVEIMPGATITASSEESFFVVAAPQVIMGGNATINGSTAYVAGEQVVLSYSDGLFDIQIPVGTTVANAIVHTGSTTGPSSTGAGDNHVIYGVASARTNPISMLFSGNLGFAPAVAADVENGDIILSAGSDVFGRQFGGSFSQADADIQIDDASFSSSVSAQANRGFLARSQTGDVNFSGDLTVNADQQILLEAVNGFSVGVQGDTFLSTGSITDGNGNVTGGLVQLFAQSGSTMNFDGNVVASSAVTQNNGAARGGTVETAAIGGTLTVSGDIRLEAGVSGFANAGTGGDTIGGTSRLYAVNGGSVSIGGTASLTSQAFSNPLRGFSATGGTTEIFVDSGANLSVEGDAFLSSGAFFADFGEFAAGNPQGTGGIARGGVARIRAEGAGGITIGGEVALNATARGGGGVDGGSGQGGLAGVHAISGSIAIGGNLSSNALAFGGNASAGFGGAGGDALGGTAFVQADGDAANSASISVAGDTFLFASGTGGTGGAGDGASVAAGRGGDGTGGTYQGTPGTGGVFAIAGRDRGSLTLGRLQISADGSGGAGGVGGSGQAGGEGGTGRGGTAQAGTFAGRGDGSVGLGQFTSGDAQIGASGIGGQGGSGPVGDGNGGDGTGGHAAIFATGSTVTGGALAVISFGTGGNGAIGGVGIGGGADGSNSGAGLGITDGGTMTLGSIYSDAQGSGGNSSNGDGGAGVGGVSTADFDGALIVTGGTDFRASGFGGSATNGNGGDGTGGVAGVFGTGGSASIGSTGAVYAVGRGGEALSPGFAGGDGLGGSATLQALSGATMTLGSMQVVSIGIGGSGSAAVGGEGSGGTALIRANGAGSSIEVLSVTSSGVDNPFILGVALGAMGFGGDTNGGTGTGGAGIGGTARIEVTDGASVDLAPTTADSINNRIFARGYGGGSSVDGGVGGSATGGQTQISVDNASFTGGTIILSSFSQGGGSLDTELNISGGDATGGERDIEVVNGGEFTATIAGGGAGAQGGNGSGSGNGGDAVGGSATFIVDASIATLVGRNTFFAGATGGAGRFGGNANGGNVLVEFSNGSSVTVVADASGQGALVAGQPVFGGAGTEQGGNAVGDQIAVIVSDSTFNGTIDLSSFAQGGSASDGVGGNAQSSGVVFEAIDSQITLGGGSEVAAIAVGGDGRIGGDANGSLASILLDGSTVTALGTLTVRDSVFGGIGSEAGGDATGGLAGLLLVGGTTFDGEAVSVFSEAETDSGTARAGTALVSADTNSAASIGFLTMTSTAVATGAGSALGGGVQLASRSGASFEIGDLAAQSNGSESGGSVSLVASGGSLNVENLTASATGGSGGGVFLFANGGDVAIGETADIDSSGDVIVQTGQGGTVGGANASIDINAGGAVVVLGDNDQQITFGANEMTINSRELDITQGARLGANTLNLIAADTGAITVIGGDTDEAGYTLTQEEAERIEAGEINFSTGASSGPSGDVLVRDLMISGSLDGGVSSVELEASGTVRVEGVLAYIDAGADDSLGIFADRLEIVTPGGIGIVDANGNPTGSFEFEGGAFWMADAETIAMLQDNVAFTGRNDRLATAASGSNDPLGYLRAGNVLLDVENSLLVRNTGSVEEPGGITVTGSLEIQNDGESAIDVFAYGRQQNSDGSFVTGGDFYDLVNFNRVANDDVDAVEYADGAAFNDCDVNSSECGDDPDPEPEPEPDIIDEIVTQAPVTSSAVTVEPVALGAVEQSEEQADAEFGIDFPDLLEAGSISEEILIDDPVSSGGDSAAFGFTEQTEGSEAKRCELDESGQSADEENCDAR